METTQGDKSRPFAALGGGILALGACAVCCAGPILAVLGGLSVASIAAAVWIPGLALIAVAALATMAWATAPPSEPHLHAHHQLRRGRPGHARVDRARADRDVHTAALIERFSTFLP